MTELCKLIKTSTLPECEQFHYLKSYRLWFKGFTGTAHKAVWARFTQHTTDANLYQTKYHIHCFAELWPQPTRSWVIQTNTKDMNETLHLLDNNCLTGSNTCKIIYWIPTAEIKATEIHRTWKYEYSRTLVWQMGILKQVKSPQQILWTTDAFGDVWLKPSQN